MKIYTKTGDEGVTSLLSGKRVSKVDSRINAYGVVDELNAYIGLLKDQKVNQGRIFILEEIQYCLFTIGAILAADTDDARKKVPNLNLSDIQMLENEIDAMQEELPPMRSFILPGGHTSVSFGHVARTVCRRAERLVVGIKNHKKITPFVVKYLNRLSDYLFMLCRKTTKELKIKEIPWKPKNNFDDKHTV